MNFLLHLDIPRLPKPIGYGDRILTIGSCFTEHMAGRLAAHKFSVLNNPHGILFNPLSVADAVDSYVEGRRYAAADLFQLNELWNSWAHHSRFSHPDQGAALAGINASQEAASAFVREADWIVVTLGTAFQYFLREDKLHGNQSPIPSQPTTSVVGGMFRHQPTTSVVGRNTNDPAPSARPVANNHRAPSQWFEKRLLHTDRIVETWTATLESLRAINPNVQVLLTVSPVRHIRDGAVANNRSKGRLLEAVHTLCERFDQVQYFPAYELVIDVLRDYRFYDLDLVHPNYAATEAVWEEFVKACIAPEARPIMEAVRDVSVAASHRPRFPDTDAHRRFKATYAAKVRGLMTQHSFLDLGEELGYFEQP